MKGRKVKSEKILLNATTKRGEEQTESLIPQEKVSIEDFEILKVIGRGAFGKVYMVRRTSGDNSDKGKVFAMKVLKKTQILQRNLKIKTTSEREILEKVNSPFIVNLRYAFQTGEKLYFVMDFLQGGELFYHLRKNRMFSEDRAKFYAAQLVLALECLHQHEIIYRDLKPENIIVDRDGYIKITDFGLSKQAVDSIDLTYSFCGTPEYLCPEIITGSGHNKSADWWSFGAVLYEMLCGRPPHYSKNRK